MELDPVNTDVTVAEAQQALADTVRTELELGMTFLDVAETTRDRSGALRSVGNALTALRNANRFMSEITFVTEIGAIYERRSQLSERLRAFVGMDDSGA